MFASDIRHWKNHQEFATHLSAHDPNVCSWVRGVVIHHTYRPVPYQWNGIASMKALQRYYQNQGWSAAPHLFICVGSRNSETDGIFQLTPLNMRGVHAGVCNTSNIGIEVVGDYDSSPWPKALSEEVTATIAHFLHWRNIPAQRIVGHRDCRSPKTCPGKAVSLPDVRKQVIQKLADLYGKA